MNLTMSQAEIDDICSIILIAICLAGPFIYWLLSMLKPDHEEELK